jgi:hypothetical protein
MERLHQCRTRHARHKAQRLGGALVLVVALAVDGSAAPDSWPPFLGPRDRYPAAVVAAVDHIWQEPTLSRTVRGRPARVPLAVWTLFVDTPELTAEAARHLKLARYEVEPLDDTGYRATDNEGARGMYRVLVREPRRRVILSWGTHRSWLLGAVSGSALSVLDFETGSDGIDPAIAAHVKIDNAVAARMARMLMTVFGGLADRKLAEGFAVTGRVAEWAVEQRQDFCGWLEHESSLSRSRRERVLAVFPDCA